MLFPCFSIAICGLISFRIYQDPNLVTEIAFSLGGIYVSRSSNCFPTCCELAVAAIRNGKKLRV